MVKGNGVVKAPFLTWLNDKNFAYSMHQCNMVTYYRIYEAETQPGKMPEPTSSEHWNEHKANLKKWHNSKNVKTVLNALRNWDWESEEVQGVTHETPLLRSMNGVHTVHWIRLRRTSGTADLRRYWNDDMIGKFLKGTSQGSTKAELKEQALLFAKRFEEYGEESGDEGKKKRSRVSAARSLAFYLNAKLTYEQYHEIRQMLKVLAPYTEGVVVPREELIKYMKRAPRLPMTFVETKVKNKLHKDNSEVPGTGATIREINCRGSCIHHVHRLVARW